MDNQQYHSFFATNEVDASLVTTLPNSWNPAIPACSLSFIDVIWEVTNHVQAPQPLVLNAALAAMTVATQALIDVETPLNQIKPVSNFFFGVAESGNRKSEVDRLLKETLINFDIDQRKRYKETCLPKHQIELEVWQTETKRLKVKAIDKKASEDDVYFASSALEAHLHKKPVKPRAPQLLYSDVTSSALLLGLARNSRAAFVSNADASSILAGQTFRKLADLNQLWDGGTLVVNRVEQDAILVDDSRLTIDIAVQLKPFNDFLQKNEKARSTGFAARCLMCVPDSMMGRRFTQRNRSENLAHLKLFNWRVLHLLQMASSLEDTNGCIDRKLVKFSEPAARQWIDWINTEIEPELRQGGYWSTVTDQASKIPEIVARLAAVITFFERGELEISLPTFQLARELGMNYLATYRNIWSGQIDLMKRDLVKNQLEMWLRTKFRDMMNQNIQTGRMDLVYIPKNRIRTYGPNPVRDKKALDETLDLLLHERKIFIGTLNSFLDPRCQVTGGEQIVVLPNYSPSQ